VFTGAMLIIQCLIVIPQVIMQQKEIIYIGLGQ